MSQRIDLGQEGRLGVLLKDVRLSHLTQAQASVLLHDSELLAETVRKVVEELANEGLRFAIGEQRYELVTPNPVLRRDYVFYSDLQGLLDDDPSLMRTQEDLDEILAGADALPEWLRAKHKLVFLEPHFSNREQWAPELFFGGGGDRDAWSWMVGPANRQDVLALGALLIRRLSQ